MRVIQFSSILNHNLPSTLPLRDSFGLLIQLTALWKSSDFLSRFNRYDQFDHFRGITFVEFSYNWLHNEFLNLFRTQFLSYCSIPYSLFRYSTRWYELLQPPFIDALAEPKMSVVACWTSAWDFVHIRIRGSDLPSPHPIKYLTFLQAVFATSVTLLVDAPEHRRSNLVSSLTKLASSLRTSTPWRT